MPEGLLLSAPNISEGRDASKIAAIASVFTGASTAVRLLDIHSDADHNRSVFTLAGEPNELRRSLFSAARAVVELVDVVSDPSSGGVHPHVGSLDVAPLVYYYPEARGVACAQALVLAEEIASHLDIPVFLYGELAGGRTRAQLRRGGVEGLRARIQSGEWVPDFGPARLHPTAGATLISAREPLVAFNLELQPPSGLVDAQRIASLIREGGAEGLPGLRAIGVQVKGGIAQVSMNVERPLETPLALIVQTVGRHAAIARAELVGLTPRAALEGFPQDLEMPGFEPARHVIENALGL
ncbi:MAG TPA: hypothetical protein VIC05_07915 [Solirubrobacteraceae bacterium]|jgi:glutamate formiminotransferase